MKYTSSISRVVLAALVAVCLVGASSATTVETQGEQIKDDGSYQVDPFWPKVNDGNWVFSSIGGLAIDATNDHLFVLNRPNTIDARYEDYAARTPPVAACCVPGAHVMEFDPAGNLVRGWGGPGPGYEWPENGHGIHVDYRGNVWIGGNGAKDAQVLKFTKVGKFLMQIGKKGKSGGSNDVENLGRPSKIFVDPVTNEVFISDGYGNRRVIVYDADTGKYKRHWGAFSNKPDDTVSRTRVPDGVGSQQFSTVHAVAISNDRLVYVADRANNRIQVFRPDGSFVKQGFLMRQTGTDIGTACDLTLSTDKAQDFLYVTDAVNQHVFVLKRDTLEPVSKFGKRGVYPGQFYNLHVVAVDSKGTVYTGENLGRRVQRWLPKGRSSN